MTIVTVRVLIAGGFFMMLLCLRLEAGRFGAAEYDEPRQRDGLWTRLSWYVIGLALIAALYFIHPQPHDVLYLLIGRRPDVVVLGAILALLGLAQAAAFAWLRYGYFRLPPARAYPDAALNSVFTAVIDEAAFRGALLGTLIAIGLPDGLGILTATLAYVLVTRSASPGRHPFMLLQAVDVGLVCGWVTLATGGIGAAIIGHAVASFALFVCTGHPGQVPLAGWEPEELARRSLPEGWQDARRPLSPDRGAEPADAAPRTAVSGFVERAERLAAARRSSGIPARLRALVGAPESRVERHGR
ncbi:MAG: CPBP family intramembrane glutamic endopeptidase [Candidatus Limnocylindrales bacterium]|jgi:hypothetical protein